MIGLYVSMVSGLLRGFGIEPSRKCPQCWRTLSLDHFVGARGVLVVQCSECRSRYSNWSGRSEAERAVARRPVKRTGDGYTVRLTLRSNNRKTGPIPVSSTDMQSCPTSCPHMDDGCFAGYGKAAMHWRNVATDGENWRAFCARVARLPEGQLWRHNDAGDLPGKGDRLDVRALDRLVAANRGRRGFSFTHKPLHHFTEEMAVARANREGFTINLSADSLADADRQADREIGPVAVVLPSDATRGLKTPAGRHVVICPAQTDGLTCEKCQLCAKPQRRAIVGFRAHGQAARRVSLRVVA